MIEGDTQWLLLCLAGFCVGLAKSGFSGFALISVFLMAEMFGKQSVGILLPMLIIADFVVYPLYRRHGSWRAVWHLLPIAVVGVAVGFVLLEAMPEAWAKPVIGSLILIMVLLQLVRQFDPDVVHRLAHSKGFGLLAGGFAGVATTIANAAGPVFQLYFLARQLPKMELIGVGARFFLVINLIKLPFMGGLAYTTTETLWLNAKLTPFILLGIIVGRYALRWVSQQVFEWMIVLFAIFSALKLLMA
ncbi:integral membrane protein [Luminiphilus syltensis NOR5-1B]|uniref:Probable membrane transporter protein n=1 Tax=Luminiphilus syltensis NOR5-1B TaxID=565045 RepID=B8KXZ0_9GAMM|nr:sulfite exporter TauE/SafE family protein [Luminiphilus syltensis]EED34338.1 integral membrane protein [Luminiphilus syltensis NOR5-1B]